MTFTLRCLILPAILALLPATAQAQLGLDLLLSQRNSGGLVSPSITNGGLQRQMRNGREGDPAQMLVVPEDTDHTSWTRVLKDWGQILYQMGLGVAALKAIRQ